MKKMIAFLMICLIANISWALQKNVASQKIIVYAYNSVSGVAITGDAGNIIANVWQDSASKAASDDTNPTELDASDAPGIYVFDMTQDETNADVITLYAVSSTAFVELDAVVIHTTPSGFPDAGMISIISAGNLESTYDGTGYNDDNAPSTQLQVSTLAGGIAVPTIATGITISEPGGGEQTLTYAATASHDGVYHEVASDDVGDDIDFYYTFNTGSGMNLPVDFHFHGYYEDNNPPPNSTLVIQAYNFNIADWETIATLTDSASDISLDLPLHTHDVDPDGGGEGDVRIRFNLTTPEASQNIRIDHTTIGYVSGGLTVAAIADGVWNETSSGHTSSGFAGEQLWTKIDAILEDTSAVDTSAEWLSLLSAVDTDATSATHDPAFVTLEAGKASNDAYNGMSISVTDATDGNTETRRIEDWTSGLKATFDRALSFTPVQDDIVRIYAMPYNVTAAIAGGSENTYIVTDTGDAGGTPISDVSVWITADSAGARLVVSGVTDSNGEVVFYLDAGTTYYVWQAKSGYSFSSNGDSLLAE